MNTFGQDQGHQAKPVFSEDSCDVVQGGMKENLHVDRFLKRRLWMKCCKVTRAS